MLHYFCCALTVNLQQILGWDLGRLASLITYLVAIIMTSELFVYLQDYR